MDQQEYEITEIGEVKIKTKKKLNKPIPDITKINADRKRIRHAQRKARRATRLNRK